MAPHTPARPRLVKIRKITLEIGIAYSTVRDAVKRGEMPVIRIGKALYLERADVDRWIETRKETEAA